MRDKGRHKEEGKREEEKGKKIKENKRNAKSGSDDRWARVEVHPDRCTSSPSQQPTPSRILTPSLSRGKAHPLCLSARGTGGRQATLEFIVHLADVERPSTMPQFLSSFSLFWPVSSPGRGLNDFNHPLSSLFFLQFYFKFSLLPLLFFSLEKHAFRGTRGESEMRNCDCVRSTLENVRHLPGFAAIRSIRISFPEEEEEVYLRLIGCIVTFLCQGWEGIVACRGKCCCINRNNALLAILIFTIQFFSV